MKTRKDLMKGMSATRRKKINKMTKDLINEELTLRALRQALQLTQVELAKELDTSQNNISKLEQRADLLISTLGNYVEGLGGQLQLIATFPDRPPVALRFGDLLAE